MMYTDEELAEIGYRAYSKSTNNKTWDNREMPRWSDLPERIQRAWIESVLTLKTVMEGGPDPADMIIDD